MAFNIAAMVLQVQQQAAQTQAQGWYPEYQQLYNQFMPSGAYDDFAAAINRLAAKYPADAPAIGDTAGKAIAAAQAAADKGDFFDNLVSNPLSVIQVNPLKYGDALGLTAGPLSGEAPGKLTDAGLDVQQLANPLVSRSTLETANDVAPYVAAAIATFGGSAVAEGAGGAATTEAASIGATVPADVAALEAPAAASTVAEVTAVTGTVPGAATVEATLAAGAPVLYDVALAAPVVEVPALGVADVAAIAAAAGTGSGVLGSVAAGAEQIAKSVVSSTIVQKLREALTPTPANPSSVQPRPQAQAAPDDSLTWLALGLGLVLVMGR